MDHAKFEQGEVLFDSLHCRSVQIITEPGMGDLHPEEAFVRAMDESDQTYNLEKKHLYSRDEISAALAHQDIDEILNDMRKDRLMKEAPLLQYRRNDFHPDDITEDMIRDLQNIEVEISKIDNHLRKRLTHMYFDGHLESTTPGAIIEAACHIIMEHKKDAY